MILLVWLVLFLSIRIFINPSPADPGQAPPILAIFAFLAIILPWVLFLEFYGTRYAVSPEGLQKKSVWRGTHFIKWEEVESIHSTLWSPGFIVKGVNAKITLNPDRRGLAIFARAVSVQVPLEKWAEVSGIIRLALPKGPYD